MKTRICSKCKQEKDLTKENFHSCGFKGDKQGFHRYCRQCRRVTRIGEYSKYYTTEEQIKKKRQRRRNYTTNTINGRAIILIKAYRQRDKKRGSDNDLEKGWFIENVLTKKCFYCGSDKQIGADRVNNKIGHLKSNIIPCCAVCNSVKSDIFTVDEMLEIGKTIAAIRHKREVLKVSANAVAAGKIDFKRVKGVRYEAIYLHTPPRE